MQGGSRKLDKIQKVSIQTYDVCKTSVKLIHTSNTSLNLV